MDAKTLHELEQLQAADHELMDRELANYPQAFIDGIARNFVGINSPDEKVAALSRLRNEYIALIVDLAVDRLAQYKVSTLEVTE